MSGPVHESSIGVVGRCEGCGLGVEVLGEIGEDTECRDCGGPVYAVAAVVDGELEVLSVDELPTGGDPYECPVCVESGSVCRFHAGWEAGWDACARFVAAYVNGAGDAGRVVA